MSVPANFERALFQVETGSRREQVEVQFNPVSLQYVITNMLSDKKSDNTKKQYVSKSTGKMTMELIFDTTDTGQDVRISTEKIGKFMEPDEKNVPPVVQFEWGTYKFKGMVESYKETIDFFAPNGVPLRANVNLTMVSQDKVFETTDGSSNFTPPADLRLDDVELPPASGPGAQSASGVAALAGDPRAARTLASANNLESMRFSGGASLVVGGSVSLKPPVAFATGGASLSAGGGLSAGAGISGGAGVGISGGAGAGISGGAGIGISGGAGISGSARGGISGGAGGGLSAGAGGGVGRGGGASKGVTASAGAFDGLRAPSAGARGGAKLDTSLLVRRSGSVSVATDGGAAFRVGGQASTEGSTSLSADVGARASLRARIRFD